jgi:hypothetical protein
LFNGLNSTCLATFGRLVSYTAPPEAAVDIRAVVSAGEEPEAAAPGESTYTRLFLRAADLPRQPANGDIVVIDSIEYVVYEARLDETGGAHLRLRRG